MSFIGKIIKKEDDPLENAPFLFPWYVHSGQPKIIRNGSLMDWQYWEKIGNKYVGVITLNCHDDIFGVFRIYDYIQPSASGTEFCVWRQNRINGTLESSLRIDLFSVSDLDRIPDVETKILSIDTKEMEPYHMNSNPKSSIMIDLTKIKGATVFEFPNDFHVMNDFITPIEFDGLYEDPNFHQTALLEIMPSTNTVDLHPQDWFNQNLEIDFGYQWITRAARSNNTGRIVGEGIRIGRFELDESNRQLFRG